MVFGRIYDVSHSYRFGYEVWAAAAFAASLIYLILPRYRFTADIGAMPEAPKSKPGAKLKTTPAPAAP